jgi:hypothetical protein
MKALLFMGLEHSTPVDFYYVSVLLDCLVIVIRVTKLLGYVICYCFTGILTSLDIFIRLWNDSFACILLSL